MPGSYVASTLRVLSPVRNNTRSVPATGAACLMPGKENLSPAILVYIKMPCQAEASSLSSFEGAML